MWLENEVLCDAYKKCTGTKNIVYCAKLICARQKKEKKSVFMVSFWVGASNIAGRIGK